MNLLFLLCGLVLGFGFAWFYFKSKNTDQTGVSIEDFNSLDKEKAIAQSLLTQKTEELRNILLEQKEQQEALMQAQTRLARAEETFRSMQEREKNLKSDFEEKLSFHKEQVEQLQKRFNIEFENIANKILEEKSQKFTEQNRSNLDIILNPLKEKIQSFEKKVEDTYKVENAERITLKAELKHLIEMNKQISDEANNLARALKGDNKKQGNWGEVILDKILERSGLIKGQEYKTQVSITTDNSKRLQPDVVIYLPDNKHIIIDSKVSLVAYESYVNGDNEEIREAAMKEHLRSLRDHIKGLSEKNYQGQIDFNSPDFVMLFVPIESSFGVAIQADQELFSFAWDKKVVIVSPSTLLASLRTISSIWKQERQNKNAQEIAVQSGALYDKFVNFLEDLRGMGQKIDAAKESYDLALNKLSTGSGNIIRRVENLKDLGAKASKSIPEKFLDKTLAPLSLD